MIVNDSEDSSSVVNIQKYKSVMNILRCAFRFRDKRAPQQEESHKMNSIEEAVSDQPSTSTVVSGSEMASTSRDSLLPQEAPSVYEDVFVAITADAYLHIKNYYVYNHFAEFRGEVIQNAHVKKIARAIPIGRLRKIYFATPEQSQLEPGHCKAWGITKNDIWWSSHLNRTEDGNAFYNVILDEGSTLRPGFTVVNLDAFIASLKCIGMSQYVQLIPGLPPPTFSLNQIPFIDDDVEAETTV